MHANSRHRHLTSLGSILDSHAGVARTDILRPAAFADTGTPPPYDPRFAPRDYLSFLLHLDAEIEHALMDQYLYAAWSLGGPQVPPAHAARVRDWQEVILGIAKEEMGHFLTIQNVLRLIGAPLNLGREEYPWDFPFSPFTFTLEPLTLDSLAAYVYAESPAGWTGPLADEIRQRVEKKTARPHRVAEIFDLMLKLVSHETVIPDSAFRASTWGTQARFDEWGRGYRDGARGSSSGTHPKGSPNVLVMPVQSRTDAIHALTAVAEQGEATSGEGPASHFVRFLSVYQDMKAVSAEGWSPARNLAVNPTIGEPEGDGNRRGTPIVHPEAQLWAELHNQRYRMLLTFLAHSFMLDDGLVSAGNRTPRGAIINATFGEMYNLRAIAGILVTLPVANGSAVMSGPPLQMPYTLELPSAEDERWQLHGDLIQASGHLIDALVPMTASDRGVYLRTLRDTDRTLGEIGSRIIQRATPLALS